MDSLIELRLPLARPRRSGGALTLGRGITASIVLHVLVIIVALSFVHEVRAPEPPEDKLLELVLAAPPKPALPAPAPLTEPAPEPAQSAPPPLLPPPPATEAPEVPPVMAAAPPQQLGPNREPPSRRHRRPLRHSAKLRPAHRVRRHPSLALSPLRRPPPPRPLRRPYLPPPHRPSRSK